MKPEFIKFPKIPRLSKGMIVTEKIDGTNAQIVITGDGEIYAGSRNRWIEIGDDNYGFAGWVEKNKEELLKLGPGQHFGEWWGLGIQRNYGQKEKRFSLFNVGRWKEFYQAHLDGKTDAWPVCCDLVPTLYEGELDTQVVQDCIDDLNLNGSKAAPGFMKPEGVVVYHVASRTAYKKMCENDKLHKGEVS